MDDQNKQHPDGLYIFNHYLMLGSLGALVVLIVLGLLTLPFLKHFSYETLDWLCTFSGWAFPVLLAVFTLSSGVVVNGFSQHRIKRTDNE